MSTKNGYNDFMRHDHENEVAQAAKVLGDPIRLKILKLLKEGRQDIHQSPVCLAYADAICPEDLKIGLGDISSSKLSYHLKELKEAGFIQECREGKRIYYLLKPDRFKSLIESLHVFY
ncbi:ArsR/SmtB family transcription factor [Paenibacillus thailandensis]|uniref:ArsR/SmtB family transcription factor n=1 Tax=Paenibacillus thailandensis TaxID=393250 RepID=A0ABW5QSN2_9BACL